MNVTAQSECVRHQLSLKLTPTEKAELNELCRTLDRSKSYSVRKAIRVYSYLVKNKPTELTMILGGGD